ncbi:MAG: Anti-sigma factor antagonist [Dactylosporangium sp.]|jgi:anti-anti-sigma factor|nr:Anti-sigma factor antagonist [Dactylosporangium sp.]
MGTESQTLNPPRFVLTTAVIGDTAVRLTVGGELDIATVSKFETVLHGILTTLGLTRLVLDFAQLTFLDARSITALHIARHTAQRHGIALTVTNCRDIVRRTLEITDLYGHLTQNDADTPHVASPGYATVSRRRLAVGYVRSGTRY